MAWGAAFVLDSGSPGAVLVQGLGFLALRWFCWFGQFSREHCGRTQVFFNAPLSVFAGCPSSSSHAALRSGLIVPSPRLGQQFSVRVRDSLSRAFSIFGWIQIVGYSFWLESGMTDAGCAGHTEGTLRGCRERHTGMEMEHFGGRLWVGADGFANSFGSSLCGIFSTSRYIFAEVLVHLRMQCKLWWWDDRGWCGCGDGMFFLVLAPGSFSCSSLQ